MLATTETQYTSSMRTMSEAISLGPGHLEGSISFSFLFQEQTFSLRRDMSQQPGQNHSPEKELTPGNLQDHSGHWPQHWQSHLLGSRKAQVGEVVMTWHLHQQACLRQATSGQILTASRQLRLLSSESSSLMPQFSHFLHEGHEFPGLFPGTPLKKAGVMCILSTCETSPHLKNNFSVPRLTILSLLTPCIYLLAHGPSENPAHAQKTQKEGSL